jgi:hypothetical protein
MQLAKRAFELSQDLYLPHIEPVSFSFEYRERAIEAAVNNDMRNVLLVVLACLLYMWWHMGSLFLGVFSLITITMSIPIGICIYGLVWRVAYFSNIHISVVIIVIGIGADDIFVFHD